MDRRTTLKWIAAAVASAPSLQRTAWGEAGVAGQASSLITIYHPTAGGYGLDPDLLKVYAAGQLWPLTFTPDQRRLATILSDLIIPADEISPSASAVGTVDFIDEWISAPYALQQRDRTVVLDGFAWLERESRRRFYKSFVDLEEVRRHVICADICDVAKARSPFAVAAKFFSLYRRLTGDGYYTTPEGRKDLGYVGNIPLVSFEGPPLEVLKKVGLA